MRGNWDGSRDRNGSNTGKDQQKTNEHTNANVFPVRDRMGVFRFDVVGDFNGHVNAHQQQQKQTTGRRKEIRTVGGDPGFEHTATLVVQTTVPIHPPPGFVRWPVFRCFSTNTVAASSHDIEFPSKQRLGLGIVFIAIGFFPHGRFIETVPQQIQSGGQEMG